MQFAQKKLAVGLLVPVVMEWYALLAVTSSSAVRRTRAVLSIIKSGFFQISPYLKMNEKISYQHYKDIYKKNCEKK